MNKQETEEKDELTEDAAVSLRELIEQQDVSPINDLDEISDLWPVDDDPDLLLQHILTDRGERRRLNSESEPTG